MDRTRSFLLAAIAVLLAGCATLPPPQDRIETTALTDTADTRLGRAVAPLVASNPGKSGIHKFPDPHDAFAARVRMAAAAEKTLDAQYFIWNGDQVGYLLFEALWQAAERGVRVRLLLDDANTSGLDATLATLDAHPNIELRLYNPFIQRGSRALGYLTDFTRLNHRMHNKSFTADNQFSVVGGRNISNEYFGAGSGIGFADIDVLVVGPAVRDISKEFDLYWNSASAYPAAGFVGAPGQDAAAKLREKFASTHADPVTVEYLQAVERAPLLAELRDGRLTFAWANSQVVYDDPAKTIDTTGRADGLLFTQLVEKMGRPEKSFDLVSPYFVPGAGGTARLIDLAKRGVKVRILTNSMAASDEAVVHAGYMTRRMELLRANLREALLQDGLDRFRAVVEPLADEFDAVEIALAAVSLAAGAAGGDTADEPEIPTLPLYEKPAPRGRATPGGPGGQAPDRLPALGTEGLHRLRHVVAVVLTAPLLSEGRLHPFALVSHDQPGQQERRAASPARRPAAPGSVWRIGGSGWIPMQ